MTRETEADQLARSAAELQVDDEAEFMDMEDEESEADQGGAGQGGYQFTGPEYQAQLKVQRQQLWIWIKRIGNNMFREGINLTKISLPVCLFEPRSFLERMTTNWEYLDLLMAAGASKDPVERMKYVVAFAVSGLCRQVSFHKPFNPILGETYQSRFPNGVETFLEQISHHPPISSWQMLEPTGKFMFFGNGNWTAGIKGNCVKGRQTGINVVRFADGSSISYELPGITVKGVLWGQRCIKYGGEMHFKDDTNNLTCHVEVDPQPKQSYISSWFRSKQSLGYKPDLVYGQLKKGDTVLDTMTGNWLYYVEWEKGVTNARNKHMWDIKNSVLTPAIPVAQPLPSDAQTRKDVVFLKAGNQALSQEWKHTLEEQQRKERILRRNFGGVVEH